MPVQQGLPRAWESSQLHALNKISLLAEAGSESSGAGGNGLSCLSTAAGLLPFEKHQPTDTYTSFLQWTQHTPKSVCNHSLLCIPS